MLADMTKLVFYCSVTITCWYGRRWGQGTRRCTISPWPSWLSALSHLLVLSWECPSQRRKNRKKRKKHLTTRSLWFHCQWEHFVPIVYFCKKCDSFFCDCYWKSRNPYLIFLVCWSWDMEHLSNFDDFILSCSFTVHYKHRNYWFYHLNSQNVVVRYMVSVFNSHENSESVSWSVLG